jgi:hypothetical protein
MRDFICFISHGWVHFLKTRRLFFFYQLRIGSLGDKAAMDKDLNFPIDTYSASQVRQPYSSFSNSDLIYYRWSQGLARLTGYHALCRTPRLLKL